MQKGFTLIELMIVVAIIGILAVVALPMYQDYSAKAQWSEAATISDGVKKEVALDYGLNTTCINNGTAAAKGVSKASEISGKYVLSVTAAGAAAANGTGGCTVTVAFKASGVNAKLTNKKVRYTLTQANNKSEWQCTTDVDDTIVPTSCTKVATIS